MASTKRATRKALRLLRGRRDPDLGTNTLDAAFGITQNPLMLIMAGVGQIDFDDNERRRRRARNKRQRAARRAGR